MHVFYRMSDAGNTRKRVNGANNISCLQNFLQNFRLGPRDSLFILADKLEDRNYEEVMEMLNTCETKWLVIVSQANSEAESFKFLLNQAFLTDILDTDYVYFLEDDFIHLPEARDGLEEGLLIADYATPYLHPDKFIPPNKGGNPLLDEKGGETTQVYFGGTAFWMLTNSTGMVFATTMKILKEDKDLWYWAVSAKTSKDFEVFMRLRDEKNRTLAMPIPAWATHSELASISPDVGIGYCCWENVLRGTCGHPKVIYA